MHDGFRLGGCSYFEDLVFFSDFLSQLLHSIGVLCVC